MQLRINNQVINIEEFDPNTTLLEFLRENQSLMGTKEGCASGDCGACTVMLRDPQGQSSTLNACIALLGALHGCDIYTVEGLAVDSQLHSAQEAFVFNHASQCGFCTPGFVVSTATLGEKTHSPSRAQVEEALAGNLCRCTGYRAIIDAATEACARAQPIVYSAYKPAPRSDNALYFQPRTLEEALRLKAKYPQAGCLAGGTDFALEITQNLADFDALIDLSQVDELNTIDIDAASMTVGAAVSYTEMSQPLFAHFPDLQRLLLRLGSLQIRNRGTLGGNFGSASPIGDLPPVVMALDGVVHIASAKQNRRQKATDFFTGYRQTTLADDELIVGIEFPLLRPTQRLFADKISKRFEDDISTVLVVGCFDFDQDRLTSARFGFGGMAATAVVDTRLGKALVEQGLSDNWQKCALQCIEKSTAPMSDVRASADYRLRVAAACVERMRVRLLSERGEV